MQDKIKNDEYARQIIDFTTLDFGGKIGATDIDLFFELSEILYIYAEFKKDGIEGEDKEDGQKKAFTSTTRAINRCPDQYAYVAYVAWEDSDLTDGKINAATAKVYKDYSRKGWQTMEVAIPLREYVGSLVKLHVENRYAEVMDPRIPFDYEEDELAD